MLNVSMSRILGAEPNLEDKTLQERREEQRRRKNASRLLGRNHLKEAADMLVKGYYTIPQEEAKQEETKQEEKSTANLPGKQIFPIPTPKAETNNAEAKSETKSNAEMTADDYIDQFNEAAAKVKEAAEGSQSESQPEVKSEAQPEAAQPKAKLSDQSEAESDAAAKARAHQPKPQPVKAPIEEDESMVNPSLKFYTHTIGNAAYRFDSGLDKEPAKELRDYVESVIVRDPTIIDEVVKEYLPDIIAKNTGMIPDVIKMIQDAEDQHIPIQAFYINAKDPDAKDEFSTWEAAKASIAKEIATYGVDPTEVFRTIWREVDEDGNPGDQLGESEVADFIENRYHGDKEELKKLLRVNYGHPAAKKPAPKKAEAKKPAPKKAAPDPKKPDKPAKGKAKASEEADTGNGTA